jgi:hypothetical protein
MKKNTLQSAVIIFLLVLISFPTRADDFELSGKKFKLNTAPKKHHDDKGILDAGLSLLIGIGFPTYRFKDNEYITSNQSNVNNVSYSSGAVYSAGTQFSINLAYEFVIYKKSDKFGIGIDANWLSMGISQYSRDIYYATSTYNNNTGANYNTYATVPVHYYDIDFRILRFGPQATFVFGQMAVDASVDIIPLTVNFGLKADYDYVQYGVFSNYAITAKARYKVFTAGFDILFGKNHYTDNYISGQTTLGNITPKVVFGFRF